MHLILQGSHTADTFPPAAPQDHVYPCQVILAQGMGHCWLFLKGGSQIAGSPQYHELLVAGHCCWAASSRRLTSETMQQPAITSPSADSSESQARWISLRRCPCRLSLRGGLRLTRASSAPNSPQTCPCRLQGRCRLHISAELRQTSCLPLQADVAGRPQARITCKHWDCPQTSPGTLSLLGGLSLTSMHTPDCPVGSEAFGLSASPPSAFSCRLLADKTACEPAPAGCRCWAASRWGARSCSFAARQGRTRSCSPCAYWTFMWLTATSAWVWASTSLR